jgi:hypothetical protein
VKAAIRIVILCAAALLQARPATASPIDELGRFEGTWHNQGTFVATPYSKARATTATTICAWAIDRSYMVCQQKVADGDALEYDLGIYSYEEATREYRFYSVRAGRATAAVIGVDGNTISYPFSFTDGDKQIMIRTLNVWATPTLYRWRSEYSADAGATWSLMGSGNSQKG